jgi:hypothetical protein
MSAPVVLMRCKCGKVWDTHGRYSTCPFCAADISNSEPAPTGHAWADNVNRMFRASQGLPPTHRPEKSA